MKRLVTVLALLCAMSLSACASNTRSAYMVPHVPASLAAHKGSSLFHNINVDTISGAKETNPMWTSQVNSQSFEDALKQVLSENEYLASGRPGHYQLSADLIELKQPLFGLTLNVNSTVEYTLVDDRTKATKFQKRVNGLGTATFNDSALAVERLRIANERSISNNLENLLYELRKAR